MRSTTSIRTNIVTDQLKDRPRAPVSVATVRVEVDRPGESGRLRLGARGVPVTTRGGDADVERPRGLDPGFRPWTHPAQQVLDVVNVRRVALDHDAPTTLEVVVDAVHLGRYDHIPERGRQDVVGRGSEDDAAGSSTTQPPMATGSIWPKRCYTPSTRQVRLLALTHIATT